MVLVVLLPARCCLFAVNELDFVLNNRDEVEDFGVVFLQTFKEEEHTEAVVSLATLLRLVDFVPE